MTDDRTYYAIGDVHGENEMLSRLHDQIVEHHAVFGGGAPATLVHLGDYVDRGPDIRGVMERIIGLHAAPPAGFNIVSIMGNHERLMLNAYDKAVWDEASVWVMNGGQETMESYRDAVDNPDPDASWVELVDRSHVAWMRALPPRFDAPDRGYVFVHAGIAPNTFPECQDEVYLWTRSAAFLNEEEWPDRPELENILVVHGHTPTDGRPDISPRRINVDTGAVYGGPLTCVVLAAEAKPAFLSVERG